MVQAANWGFYHMKQKNEYMWYLALLPVVSLFFLYHKLFHLLSLPCSYILCLFFLHQKQGPHGNKWPLIWRHLDDSELLNILMEGRKALVNKFCNKTQDDHTDTKTRNEYFSDLILHWNVLAHPELLKEWQWILFNTFGRNEMSPAIFAIYRYSLTYYHLFNDHLGL